MVIMFESPAAPPLVTRLTYSDAIAPLVLVAVNLSMIARTPLGAVYCVVCAASACFAGMMGFAVTVTAVLA